ncbi:MAG: redoxin domain-containing protein [Alphaproteobacteria bacterium]
MKLQPDAQVPALELDTVGGGRWALSTDPSGRFTMIVFYRGFHCPLCKTYLQGLEVLVDQYRHAGLEVVAVSMDDAERARKAVIEWGLARTPVAYGLGEDAARRWGLYLSQAIKSTEIATFCEPGLFWVRPDGRLYLADVSNMPWARPDLEFLLSRVPRAISDGYPARGTYFG